MRALLLLALALPSSRAEEGAWLTLNGAGDLSWGTDNQPFEAIPRDRSVVLPDAGYIGARPGDRPDDLEVPGPHPRGERRYLRYVGGKLVDAWMVRSGPIDTTAIEVNATEAWRGPALGPGDGKLRGIGDAVSWDHGGHTVLHWKDRMSDTEVLVVRSRPSQTYAVTRAKVLEPGGASGASIRIKGTLKPTAKPVAGVLSHCFDPAPKPVEAKVTAVYDQRGRLGRVSVQTDSPSLEVEECVAGALIRTTAGPKFAGDLELFRMR